MAVREEGAERLTLHELGGNIENAVFEADVINSDDAGMVEAARGTRFLRKTGAARFVAGKYLGEDFQRDVASQPRIAGAENFTHPAGAERGHDLVRADASAGSD